MIITAGLLMSTRPVGNAVCVQGHEPSLRLLDHYTYLLAGSHVHLHAMIACMFLIQYFLRLWLSMGIHRHIDVIYVINVEP